MKSKHLFILGLVLIALAAVLVACQSATQAPATPCPEASPCPTCPTCPPAPTAAPCPDCPKPVVENVPNADKWAASGHNNVKGEQFRHWDDATANPDGVPTSCAKCHTSDGFVDFATNGKVTKAVPAANAQGITCAACHNDAAEALDSVKFPSGKVVETSEEGEGLCMQCHQGRESKVSVDKQIAQFKLTDNVDVVATPLVSGTVTTNFGFRNVHYFAAGGTLYGSQAQMGYEYDGQTYDPKFRHVDGMDTCIACHDQHSTTVRVEKCAECHEGVKTVEDLQNVRMNGSLVDYNGNGDTKEGIAKEIAGLQETLLASIQAYAQEVGQKPIKYDGATYPYFLGDDGKAYTAWTARLLKAAYNYQVSAKDPGAFAHNAKYIIELLYDSIADLNTKLSKPVDMSKMHRIDAGHFAGSTMPFRDWDSTGVVPFGCAKCHSATGLPEFIKNGGSLALSASGSLTVAGISSQPTANGFMCVTCHDASNFPALYAVVNVPFPSGASLTFSTEKDDKGNLKPVNANLCLECHQGRESTVSVDRAIAATKPTNDDQVPLKADGKTPALGFKNVHYLGAGATVFGTNAKGAYEFKGQTYLGTAKHVTDGGFDCSTCHDVHALDVKTDKCVTCHKMAKDGLDKIYFGDAAVDYNGDGKAEGMEVEIAGMRDALYAAIQAYALDKTKVAIVYDTANYPYFYQAGADGKPAKNDKGAAISFTQWTPNLLRAAYNLQYSFKDPGAFAHNGKYVVEILYDSIKAVGGDVSKMTRPEVPAAK